MQQPNATQNQNFGVLLQLWAKFTGERDSDGTISPGTRQLVDIHPNKLLQSKPMTLVENKCMVEFQPFNS